MRCEIEVLGEATAISQPLPGIRVNLPIDDGFPPYSSEAWLHVGIPIMQQGWGTPPSADRTLWNGWEKGPFADEVARNLWENPEEGSEEDSANRGTGLGRGPPGGCGGPHP